MLFKFSGMAIGSFAAFTIIARCLPGIGQAVAFVLLVLAVCPFFLAKPDDAETNPNGGIEALVMIIIIGLGALLLGGLR
jgi:hypothetical protein